MICELVFGTQTRTRPFLALLARKAAQVWNEWILIHEEDQTLQNRSTSNSNRNSTASMSVTEDALRNMQQQQQQQRCHNDRINSPNRHNDFLLNHL
jgi:hypothetical protein